MARLGDLPYIFKTVGIIPYCRRVWREVTDDSLFTWASALAYSWLFAIFPFLLFLLALLPYLPSRTKDRAVESVRKVVYEEIPSTESADMIWNNVAPEKLVRENKRSVLLLGLGLALWSAAGGMAMTMSALDRCYDVERGRNVFKQRAIAVALTIVVIVLMVGIICLLPVATLVKAWMTTRIPNHLILVFDIARWTLSVLFMVSVLALVYHFGPSVRQRFHWLTPGAAFCVVVWVTLAVAFRIYIERMGGKSYAKTYGAVGGVVILLLFFYIDAVVLLIGAEINSEIDFQVLQIRRGTRDFRKADDLSHPAPTSI